MKDMKVKLPIQVTISNDDFKIFTWSECPDKKMHKCGIAKAHYSLSIGLIFCLDNVGDAIYLYDWDLKVLKNKIWPIDNKGFQGIILDFAIDEENRRIGTVLKDYSLCFWE